MYRCDVLRVAGSLPLSIFKVKTFLLKNDFFMKNTKFSGWKNRYSLWDARSFLKQGKAFFKSALWQILQTRSVHHNGVKILCFSLQINLMKKKKFNLIFYEDNFLSAWCKLSCKFYFSHRFLFPANQNRGSKASLASWMDWGNSRPWISIESPSPAMKLAV